MTPYQPPQADLTLTRLHNHAESAQALAHELQQRSGVKADDTGIALYITVRKNRAARARHGFSGSTLQVLCDQAIQWLAECELTDAHTVDLTLAYAMPPFAADVPLPANKHRGIRGIALRAGSLHSHHTPLEMIARNISFHKLHQRFTDEVAGKVPYASPPIIESTTFSAVSLLMQCRDDAQMLDAHAMHRGQPLISPEEVTTDSVTQMSHLMAEWMARAVQDDGRLMYKYWPSRGEESQANNMIRQWMGTACLFRMAHHYGSNYYLELAERNLQYNLTHFYVEDSRRGYIIEGEKVKLGAAALALLTLLEHPEQQRFSEQIAKLDAFIHHQWQPDGSFRTFYQPVDRNDCQNFYPGEALLAWVTLYEQTQDAALLEKIQHSITYYCQWHAAQPNPAFVPWHSMAYCQLWQHTQQPELAQQVFAMNDWLVTVQQWDDAPSPDMMGRFYAPTKPYGPPHASSTGVYMEGLIAAYQLAELLDDQHRMALYSQSIRRGLRSIMQLQYRTKQDAFYTQKHNRVLGGVRTTVYDNTIRVDNVQHNLMAMLTIMRSSAL